MANISAAIPPIHIKVGVVPKDLFRIFNLVILGCIVELLFHIFQLGFERMNEKKKKESKAKHQALKSFQCADFTGGHLFLFFGISLFPLSEDILEFREHLQVGIEGPALFSLLFLLLPPQLDPFLP